MRLTKLLIITIFGINLWSCSPKDETPIPALSITPNFTQASYSQGDTIDFKITGRSDDGLVNIKITEITNANGIVVLSDSAIKSSQLETTFRYIVKNSADYKAYQAMLQFSISDDDGDINNIYRELFIMSGSRRLVLTSSQLIYTNNSGKNSGYDLIALTNITSTSSTDLLDILDSPTAGLNSPEKRWTSPAGGRFVLAPTFDFNHASDSSTIKAYNLANKLTTVAGFKEGDVILTKIAGTTDSVYAAIKIVTIFDSTGTTGDRYKVDIKK